MKKKVTIYLSGVVILLGLVILPYGNVSANYLGGSFPHTPGKTTKLKYKYEDPHRYNGNVWQGAANWRNAANKVKPTEGTSGIKILVTDVNLNDQWYGQTWFTPCKNCTYTKNGFYINKKYTNPLNDFDRTFVATHEFGHTLGLAHTQVSSHKSVMKKGGPGFTFPAYNTPMPYDKGQINAWYN